ncbi:MAG: hypothetical protein WC321_06300 [Candidatus Omnitrophota bacterium]|jgi:Flp pilus assembly pilin Flp
MKRASAFMEYAIILGVVATALLTMNIYVKRGLQGKVKDMADYFINDGQEAQVMLVDPLVKTESTSEITADSSVTNQMSPGGERRLALLDTAKITAESTTTDEGSSTYSPENESFVAADEGEIETPVRPPEDENYDIEQAEEENDALMLERYKEKLLLQAAATETAALQLKAQGENMIKQAQAMHCPKKHGGACRSARRKMLATGQQMVKDAQAQLQEAADLREEAENADIDDIKDEVGDIIDDILEGEGSDA